MKFPSLLLALPFALALPAAQAAPDPPPPHWVGTWSTANFGLAGRFGNFGAADMTYREIVHTTLAGPLVRVELTNEFGTEPLIVGAVHLALAGAGGDVQLASANAMTFNGKASITIPPGAVALSDPAALAVPANADLAISLYLPAQQISTATVHGSAYTTSYTAAGNVVGQKTLPSPGKVTSWAFLKAVDVQAIPPGAAAIVAFGDSITDGHGSTVDAHDNWPGVFARRLQGNKKTKDLAVLNAGISGNLLLHDNPPQTYGPGPSGLARFDRDVLALPGVRFVVLLEGINDIGRTENPVSATHDESAEDLIQGYVQLVERAHTHGLKVIVGTVPPYKMAQYASPAGEEIRKALNIWIRTSKLLDGVIDFDEAMRSKSDPDAANPAFIEPDHLHPSPAGYKSMADHIDLKLFELNKKEKYEITHQQ